MDVYIDPADCRAVGRIGEFTDKKITEKPIIPQYWQKRHKDIGGLLLVSSLSLFLILANESGVFNKIFEKIAGFIGGFIHL